MRILNFTSLVLITMTSITGCTQLKQFTGTITAHEHSWSSEGKPTRIQTRIYDNEADTLLLASSKNDKIGAWDVLVKVDQQKPEAWLLLGNYTETISKEEAIERWGKHSGFSSPSSLGLRHTRESVLNCSSETREDIVSNLSGIRQLSGLISISQFTGSNHFNIVLDAHSIDNQWHVRGKFEAKKIFNLGDAAKKASMLAVLVPLTALNAAHRAVDSEAPQMVFP
ncbi:MAG: hypothetical protein ISR75_06495 [Phycisphaerales bacterium]|nr:hypothetical protein [Planctomycetota bacterium]MBL6998067.1 hypothetical protein [Phycisphaerales bacterium]